MRRIGSFLLRLLAVGLFASTSIPESLFAQPTADSKSGTLYLKNGDYVSGQLGACDTNEEVRWRSSLFQEPLRFDVRGVSHITYGPAQVKQPDTPRLQRRNPLAEGFLNLLNRLPRAVPSKKVTGARIELVGGSVLIGDVLSLDMDHLHVHSPRHGDLSIRREYVAELDGLSENASLLFDGTANLAAWTVLGSNVYSSNDWRSVGRELVTDKVGANLYYRLPKKGRFVYEIALAGKANPDFRLVFAAAGSLNDIKSGFSVETWGDDLVIHRQTGDQVEHKTLERPSWKKPDWALSLQVYCDPSASRLAVFSEGRLLGEMTTEDESSPTGQGLLIRNQGAELRVLQARLRRWLGPMHDEAPTDGSDLVVLTDGTWTHGRIASFSADQNQLLLERPDGNRSLPADRVDRIRFAASDTQTTASEESDAESGAWMQIAYLDGGGISGRYLKVDEKGIWLATDFSDRPVLAGWLNMLDVRLKTADMDVDSVAKNGLVQHAGCVLHGRVLNGTGPADLRWEPVNSRHHVAFLANRTTRVTFGPRDHRLSGDHVSSGLALANGDVIPCEVDAIDDQFVYAQFVAGETAKIPLKYFKALRDYRRENCIYGGFSEGDQWYANRKDPDLFQLRDGAGEFHGSVLLARELPLPDRFRVSFDAKFRENTSLIVGIGADTVINALDRPESRSMNEDRMREAARKKPDNLIEMTLVRQGRSVTARGTSRVAGILGLMFRANVMGVRNNRNASLALGEDASLHVEFFVDRPAREYVVVANGKEMYRWRDPTPLDGQVLHVGIAPAQRGAQRVAQTNAKNRPSVVVYNFRVDRWPGMMEEKHRDRFLTRRMGASEKSVTHALRAINGDSLRGRLLRMQDDTIEFQTRLDTLSIPRESIVEIISLSDMADVDASAGETDPQASIRVALRGGKTVTLNSLKASGRFILGESPMAGPISLPREAVSMIEFGGQSHAQPPFADWVVRDPPRLPTFDQPGDVAPSDWLDKLVPDFNIKTLDGGQLALSDLRGRPVILDFWASWCGPCIASMPTMMEIADEYTGKVEFIAVNLREDPAEVREFVLSRLWKLRVGLDQDGSLGRVLGVNAIPYTLIIDRDGILRHVHVGATPDLKQEISDVLDELIVRE